MNIPVENCFAQIIRSMEQVVIPELSSDFARGQAFAIMELLGQIEPRIGYRHDLLIEDFDYAREALQVILQALTQYGVVIPEKMKASAGYGKTGMEIDALELREQLALIETVLSQSIDLFYENKGIVRDFEAVEKKVMEIVLRQVERDVRLIRPGRYQPITPTEKGGKKDDVNGSTGG